MQCNTCVMLHLHCWVRNCNIDIILLLVGVCWVACAVRFSQDWDHNCKAAIVSRTRFFFYLTRRLRFPSKGSCLRAVRIEMHSRDLLVNESTGEAYGADEVGERQGENRGWTLVCGRIRRECDRAREGNLIEWERKREKRECGGTIVDSESHLASRLLFIVPCYSGFPRQSGRDAVKKS